MLLCNKDFAERFLDSHIKGDFLVGEETQELHDEFDELKGPRCTRAMATRKREGCVRNLEEALTELDSAWTQFEPDAWQHWSRIPTEVRPALGM